MRSVYRFARIVAMIQFGVSPILTVFAEDPYNSNIFIPEMQLINQSYIGRTQIL